MASVVGQTWVQSQSFTVAETMVDREASVFAYSYDVTRLRTRGFGQEFK